MSCGKEIKPNICKVYYWNLSAPIKLTVKGKFDDNKEYFAILIDDENKIKLLNKKVSATSSNLVIEALYPEDAPLSINDSFKIQIRVSKKHKAIADFAVIQDTYLPYITILSMSPRIVQGGSAMIVFEAKDENIKSIYIMDNWGHKFYPQRFGEDEVYACMVGWFLLMRKFKAKIIVKDQAGNVSVIDVPFKTKQKKYPVAKINMGNRFVSKKKKELNIKKANMPKDKYKQYKYITKQMRKKRRMSVTKLTTRLLSGECTNFTPNYFRPIGKHRVTSKYGLLRKYYYKGKKMKQSYHLGIDLARKKQAPIRANNYGKVIFADYNGGYGNTIVIDFGLGVYALYAHCSKLKKHEGDFVKAGDIIALTGQTGYASGDHLHFSILITGVYVNPVEWMSQEWINKNIIRVLERAKWMLTLRPES